MSRSRERLDNALDLYPGQLRTGLMQVESGLRSIVRTYGSLRSDWNREVEELLDLKELDACHLPHPAEDPVDAEAIGVYPIPRFRYIQFNHTGIPPISEDMSPTRELERALKLDPKTLDITLRIVPVCPEHWSEEVAAVIAEFTPTIKHNGTPDYYTPFLRELRRNDALRGRYANPIGQLAYPNYENPEFRDLPRDYSEAVGKYLGLPPLPPEPVFARLVLECLKSSPRRM